MSIPRPIILHGMHPLVQTPPIIRLQRPIIIPSMPVNLPMAMPRLPSAPTTSTNLVHQLMAGLRAPLPPSTVLCYSLNHRVQ